MIILSFDIGVKNLAYCLFYFKSEHTPINLKDAELEIIEWDVIDLNEFFSTKKPSFNERTNVLLIKIHELFSLIEIDYVLIENQPVLKNPIMKSIQMIIYTYFKHLQLNESKLIKDTLIINASNKIRFALNVLSKEFKEDIEISKDKKSYKDNKQLAITYIKKVLNYKNLLNQLEFFNSYSKKDDLADTLLQGLYYCYSISS